MHKQVVALLAFGLSFAVCQTNFTISKQDLTDPSQDLPEFPCDNPASGKNRTATVPAHPTFSCCLCVMSNICFSMLPHSVCVQLIPRFVEGYTGFHHPCILLMICLATRAVTIHGAALGDLQLLEGVVLGGCSAPGRDVGVTAAEQHPAAGCGAHSLSAKTPEQ